MRNEGGKKGREGREGRQVIKGKEGLEEGMGWDGKGRERNEE